MIYIDKYYRGIIYKNILLNVLKRYISIVLFLKFLNFIYFINRFLNNQMIYIFNIYIYSCFKIYDFDVLLNYTNISSIIIFATISLFF